MRARPAVRPDTLRAWFLDTHDPEIRNLKTLAFAMLAVVTAATPTRAEQVPCDTIRHYAKTYTVAQMESWARAQRYSEATIQAAKACLRAAPRPQRQAGVQASM